MDRIIISNKNQPLAATVGFFDGVHAGHRFLFERLKQIAREKKISTAIITFPVHPQKIMHDSFIPALLTSFDEKMNLLTEIAPDLLIPEEFTHKLSQLSAEVFMRRILVNRLNVTCLLIGYDHRFGKGRTEDFDDYVAIGKKYGLEVIRAEACEHNGTCISSSFIRELLLQGDVRQANQYLTYNYKLEGIVIHGQQIGQSIGFPTANIQPIDNEKVIPATGVYAVKVCVSGIRYDGMLNIGTAPTISPDRKLTIEVHIFDFNQDIYGKNITIEFIDYIRNEMTFSSLDELKNRLIVDKEIILKACEIIRLQLG